MKKVLIIKTGWSETFRDEVFDYCSLGDVLRTTPLLHKFSDYEVTWITDKSAMPLLIGIPNLTVLPWGLETSLHLSDAMFDLVINLEKVSGIAAWATRLDWQDYIGFKCKFGRVSSYVKRELKNASYQGKLFAMCGFTFAGEEMLLGYKPEKRDVTYAFGLNNHIGTKYPNKEWSIYNWRELHRQLYNRYICEQPKPTTLERYITWVNNCDTLITTDSLGLHLALALGKKVIGLFGPTDPEDIFSYLRLHALKVSNDMDDITVEQVMEVVNGQFANK